jgi:transcriptional regulator of nitric oxide reductase/ferredoxin
MIQRIFETLGPMLCILLVACSASAEPLPRDEIASLIRPPFSLGEALNDKGVYQLLNSGGEEAGYVFETTPLAPIPGFGGHPINLLVTLSPEGRFLDLRLIEQREPIFLAGIGEGPFLEFLKQYPDLSITQSIVVGVPYGGGGSGSDLVYLDGITKATASARIAHETILAATLIVAREKMDGLGSASPARPKPDYHEDLTWQDLVDQGIARRLQVTNAEVDEMFAGTKWAHDDPIATQHPTALYLDLWLVDIGPASIAQAIVKPESLKDLASFQDMLPEAEPLLVLDAGRHGLVSDDFVRNTAPDRLSASQGGLPTALRDADLWLELKNDVPDHNTAMILRADRRLGFDPTSEWTLKIQAVRTHGNFQPETVDGQFSMTYAAPQRFFDRPEIVTPLPAWIEALFNRKTDLIILAITLVALGIALGPQMSRLAGYRHFTAIRLVILAFVVGFIGWWGQGQLSIVTVIAVLRAALGNGSFAVLLYDPFSLLIWIVTVVGFFLWGRGLFCGWLCPFGALQEFAHHIGKALNLKQINVSHALDRHLKKVKYISLFGLIFVAFFVPSYADKAAEIEPFKTAITVIFVREWYYVIYAAFWLVIGMVTFKGFCRYVCPLGAFMAIGGLVRGRDWIARREDCGSPCQLCRVKCKYGAIEKSGKIQYDECFQCLDCVTIHDSDQLCVPLILNAKKGRAL